MSSAGADLLSFAGSSLGEYRHVCALFDTRDDEYSALIPFIREGLAQGERTVSFVPRSYSDHWSRLAAAGIDVERARTSRQLEACVSEETYTPDGRFDVSAMLDQIQESLHRGPALGFRRTRLAGHAEHVLADAKTADDFLEYEARLNCIAPTFRDPVVCIYDITKMNAGMILDVLRTHPVVVISGLVQTNPFFVPPDVFLAELGNRRAGRGSAPAPVARPSRG
jgi:hypothetical protein